MVTTGVVCARFIGKSRVQISAKSMVAQSKVCSIHYYDPIQLLLYILACCGRVVCGVELGYFLFLSAPSRSRRERQGTLPGLIQGLYVRHVAPGFHLPT